MYLRPISPEQGRERCSSSRPASATDSGLRNTGPGIGHRQSANSTATDADQRTPRGVGLLNCALDLAILEGVLGACLGAVGHSNAAWSDTGRSFRARHQAARRRRRISRQIDRLKPQKQAEALLELAVGHSDGAVDQISSRVERWQGKVQWNSQIASLTTAALNSNDMRVRESGIEVELAAYGLAKNSASLDYAAEDGTVHPITRRRSGRCGRSA